jgi:large subunit ribosomal protein L10
MVKESKKVKVQSLREKIAKAKSVVVAEYHGIDANDVNNLRQQLRDGGNEMTVAKNTLLKIALEEEKIDIKELEEHLEGPNATIFAYEDSVSPIKIIVEFAKKLELPKIKAAIVDGVFTSSEKVEALSKLPGKQELLAQVVGGMKAPLSGFVNVLGGTQQKFARVINAIKESKE